MSFEPPSASSAVLQGLDFSLAIPVAADCKADFDAADAHPDNRDPSRCKVLLRFPDGTVFWSSKMAIDADGPAAGPGRLSGSELDPEDGEGQDETTYRFPNGGPFLSSEVIPYLVVPLGKFRGATGRTWATSPWSFSVTKRRAVSSAISALGASLLNPRRDGI